MKFRNDINSLRAIAVMAVIFYHFQVPHFWGGFLGVDIFFVISGYLMSKIILEGFVNSKFSLKDFYFKRVKRIIPALLALVFFVLVIGNFLFFPTDLKLLSQYALTSLLFISNMFYWLKSGYFDPASKNNVLLHTWTLSVEWQFYMIYPLLLMLLKKLYLEKRKLFRKIIVAFIFLTYIITLIFFKKGDVFAFYSFPTRAWEMVTGCAVFLFEKDIANKVSSFIRNIFCLLGYGIIFISILLFDENTTWPNIYTGIPIIATFLILVCNCDFSFFKNKLIQFVGKISYSLYLWHWPLYVFATALAYNKLKYTPAILILTFFFSFLSYRFIESNRKIASPQKIIVCTIAAVALSFFLYLIPINQYFIDKNIIALSDYKKNHEAEINEQMKMGSCFLYNISTYKDFPVRECLNLSDSQQNVLLIGDSHAADLSLSLRKELAAQNKNLLQATTSECPFFLNPKGRDENVKLVKYILYDFIPKNYTKINMVIVSLYWKNIANEDLKMKIPELIAYLQKFKIKVKLIGQTKTYSIPYPSIAAKDRLLNLSLDDRYLEDLSPIKNTFMQSFIPQNIYVDVYDIKGIKKMSGNTLYMYDDNHLTEFGADQLINYAVNNGLFN